MGPNDPIKDVLLCTVVPFVEVDGAYERFEGVAVHAAVTTRSGVFLKQFIDTDSYRQLLEVLTANDSATHLREKTFVLERVFFEKHFGDYRPEYGVPQVFEPFIAKSITTCGFQGERAVAECQLIHRKIGWIKTQQIVQGTDKLLFLCVRQDMQPEKGLDHEEGSGLVLPDDDGGVVSAETERVAQRGVHSALLRLVEREVEFGVKSGIVREVVDGWRYFVIHH